MTEFDPSRILEVLARHQVEFVVIGGFAAELYQAPIPPTQDIDITPRLTQPNLARLSSALDELGATTPVQQRGPTGPGGQAAPSPRGRTVRNRVDVRAAGGAGSTTPTMRSTAIVGTRKVRSKPSFTIGRPSAPSVASPLWINS